jgi:hypothetical protein
LRTISLLSEWIPSKTNRIENKTTETTDLSGIDYEDLRDKSALAGLKPLRARLRLSLPQRTVSWFPESSYPYLRSEAKPSAEAAPHHLLQFSGLFHNALTRILAKNRAVFRFIAAQYYTAEMSKHLESLYQNLINGKLPHNLSWNEAVELVGHLGEVQAQGDDEFVFRVGSQHVFFKRPHTHDLGVEEVSRLRKFLKEAGSDAKVEEESAQPSRMIVVVDHHAAHVYRDFGGSRPADEHEVRPYDPLNFHHHLIHRKEAHYRGERVPEEDSFYEEIAKDVAPTNEIVIIGHATGKSSAAEFLKEYLKTHHPDIARRVIATESADLSAVTEPEIEALARRHMIAV